MVAIYELGIDPTAGIKFTTNEFILTSDIEVIIGFLYDVLPVT
jgi:hypothetical protein